MEEPAKLYVTSDLWIYGVNGVYVPAEDTWLLLDLVSSSSMEGEVVVDTCAGTGVVGLYILKYLKPAKVIFIDIDTRAVENIMLNVGCVVRTCKAVVLQCSFLSCLPPGKMDVVVANPPYLPGYEEYRDLVSGPRGYEAIVGIVEEAREVLKPGGRLYLVYSSLSKPSLVEEYLAMRGFVVSRKRIKHYFFEDIIAVEAVKKL